MRPLFFLLCLSLLCVAAPAAGQDGYIRSTRLGITFISSLDHLGDQRRYDRALLLGAGWNRWPLYWDQVERAPGLYDWSGYDQLVSADLRHGLKVNAILLGRPDFRQRGGAIEGLGAPTFSDGSDTLSAGKMPNPANPWALFVYQAVLRYKPGGLLAGREGWSPEWGVTVWEAWNEPDLPLFWNGSPDEYARLLKVTYLAAHAADPSAQVMFGGLAYGNADSDDWLAKVLAIYANDPARTSNHWYMDIVAVHNYSYARRSGLVVRRVKENLSRYGLERPVWLNESGVPVWDDYPGPTWARDDPASRRLRATAEQQAAFLVQSTVYAWAAGAEVVFFHQLYDDCGNQSGGTDFPPHNGELCLNGVACWGDAHGLYRNERGDTCFSQHPLPGSPRPAAAAFYRLAQVFGSLPLENAAVEAVEGGTVVTFDRPAAGDRVVVLWNRALKEAILPITAQGDEATLYSMDDQDWLITPQEGVYPIGLPPATRDDYPYLPAGEVTAIGGPPFLLIERPSEGPLNPALVPQTLVPLGITPGAITATQPPRPTVDPAFDTSAPVTSMLPLPIVSPAAFTVYWSAQDDSGIERYLIWVRVDGGDWQPWLETAATQAVYNGVAGSAYEFAAWAVDLAGNWSLNTELTPQASTAVQ